MTGLPSPGESFPAKVSAEFDNQDEAQAASERVSRHAGIDTGQIRIVEPDDPALERKLEPESGGIARSLISLHIMLGVAGLGLGILAALVMIVVGVGIFARNPWYTIMAFSFFGAVAGLLIAGLAALRPDHDRMIATARESAGNGNWLVVVHARDSDEERMARDVLRGISDRVVGTL
jgi:hypothetical protein